MAGNVWPANAAKAAPLLSNNVFSLLRLLACYAVCFIRYQILFSGSLLKVLPTHLEYFPLFLSIFYYQ